MTLDPAQAARNGRLGGLTNRARHTGREMTAAAREGFQARFGREVDAYAAERGEVLTADERAARIAAMQRAHMARLATKRHADARAQRGRSPTAREA